MVSGSGKISCAKSPRRVALKRPEEEKVAEKYVFIKELARHMNRERSSLVINARKKGMNFLMVRDPESGRSALALTVADAKRLMDMQPPSVEIVKPEEL